MNHGTALIVVGILAIVVIIAGIVWYRNANAPAPSGAPADTYNYGY